MTTRAVHDGLFDTRDDGSIALIGGYSPSSRKYHFPLLTTCPYTGAADIEAVELSTHGTLWGWTAVTAPPPGYQGPIPYGFGVVELPAERLRIITRLTESDPAALRFGQPMRLVPDVLHLDDEGVEVVTWAFTSDTEPATRSVR